MSTRVRSPRSHGDAPSSASRGPLALPGAIVIAVVIIMIESVVYYFIIRHQVGAFSDLLGRASNFSSLKTSGNIYTDYTIEVFSYPPGGILLLSPIILIPTKFLPVVWTLMVLSALAGALLIVVRRCTRLSDADAVLLATLLTVVSPIAFSAVFDDMFWGQIATALTLAIVADFLLVRGRYQGVLVGLATSLKIYPGVFIVMWLVRRQYRQACTALITVIVVTGAACLLWYHSAVSFYHNQVLGGQELGRFSVSTTAQGSSSIADLFLRPPDFLGHLSAHNSLIIVGVFVIFGVITSYGAWRHGYELTAVLVGLDISIICSPIAWNHYFAFLPLLVFVPFEIGWHRWTTRAAYFAMVVNMVPWHRWRDAGAVQILMPKGQLYLSFVAQNATLVSMLLFLFAAAYEFWPESLMLRRRRSSTRRTDPPAATPEPLLEPSHTVAPRSRVTHAPLDQ